MFLNHANVRVNLGPLRWLIAGPDFHQWHHCENPAAYNRNFSPHLVIFDRLPKKEAALLTEELNKLQATLGGIRKMKRLPGAIFIVDDVIPGQPVQPADL